MPPVAASETSYTIHCLEKENDRLIESVKQIRQNALALAAAVLVLVSTTALGIGEPLIKNLKNAQYEESIQAAWMGPPQTPERDYAAKRLALIWDIATIITMISQGITISVVTFFILIRGGKYAPDRLTLESMTVHKYQGILLDQFDALKKLTNSFKWPLIVAACSALVTIGGCSFVTLLWLWFGGAAKASP
jgi:hypothetical protein